jgi:hypothetical protein
MFSHLRQLCLFAVILFPACCLGAQDLSGLTDEPSSTKVKDIFFKIDQGFSLNRLLDQKMSNLHYTGPGGILNFGRRVHAEKFTAEWNFARLQFHYTKPVHESTVVYNPAYGIRYMHLRKLQTASRWHIEAGGQADMFANVRIAPRLGNSFLFADFIGELSPRVDGSASYFFIWKNWDLDFSLSASVLGMAVRMPEYGVSFQLSEDGGVKVQGYEAQLLHPLNYSHIVTGIFIRESFGSTGNPNWFRLGYIWDYYTMGGRHHLNVNHATHQFVFELYFKVN